MTTLNVSFDLNRYPTLQRFAQSEAKIRIVLGPAGCLPAETEILTRDGWQPISQPTSEAMVYDPTTYTAFFDAVEHVDLPCPHPFHRFFNSNSVDMVVSANHRIWYQTYYEQYNKGKYAKWMTRFGDQVANHIRSGKQLDAKIPAVFDYCSDTRYPLTDEQLRVCVMLAADGSIPSRGSKAVVNVVKERKVKRARLLLEQAGIPYDEVSKYHEDKGHTEYRFTFVPPERDKDLTRFYEASVEQLAVIAEEALHWDGHVGAKGAYFCSADKAQVDFMQFAFVMTGTPSIVATNQEYPDNPNWKNPYRASFGIEKKNAWVNLKTCRHEYQESTDGRMYCLTTRTGMFIARHNGRVFATGNSAKTSYCFMELVRLAMLQEPAPDGTRYSMAVVVRNTYDLLVKSTVPSLKRMLGPLYKGKDSIPPQGKVRFPLPDGTSVDLTINFMSVDTPEDEKKFLGFEPTFVMVDEVSEVNESLIHAAVRRLGRFPSGQYGKVTRSCLIGTTNGPVEGHWLHQWWMGRRDEDFKRIAEQMGIPIYAEVFRQPPALLRPTTTDPDLPTSYWQPNPLAENIHNLADGYGYYYSMLAGSPESVAAYVEGDFARLSAGRVVFREFNRSLHVVPDSAIRPQAPYHYLLSFDFGRTPVCLIGMVTPDGSLAILDEVMGDDMSVEQLFTEQVQPLLRSKYKGWVCEDATGDPAGMVEDQSTPLSPFKVLQRHGVPIRPVVNNNKLEPRLNAVRWWLTQLSLSGKPRLLISDKCNYLIEALGQTYIYEKVRGQTDVYKETPTKSHVNWVSDLCFTGDTLVWTEAGERPISEIKAGDKVWTRQGLRTVLVAGRTSPLAKVKRYHIAGRVLEATPGHPIFANGGYVAIDELVGNSVYCLVSKQNTWTTWLKVKRILVERLKMFSSMMVSVFGKPVSPPLRNGIGRKKDELGTESTLKKRLELKRRTRKNANARGAEKLLLGHRARTGKVFAAHPVKGWLGKRPAWMTKIERVLFARLRSELTNMELSRPVAKSVKTRVWCEPGESIKPVYNLTVEGCHEYFANDVLVHNCDGLQYMALQALSITNNQTDYNLPPSPTPLDTQTWMG